MRPKIILVAGALALLLPVASAYAYIDPGAGSLLIQGLLAGVAGAAAALSFFWGRIKGLWSRIRGKGSRTEDVSRKPDVGPRA